jgi:hypothetical protein
MCLDPPDLRWSDRLGERRLELLSRAEIGPLPSSENRSEAHAEEFFEARREV